MMNTSEIIAIALIKYGPALAKALIDLLKVETPTPEMWNAVFALAEKPYEEYVKQV